MTRTLRYADAALNGFATIEPEKIRQQIRARIEALCDVPTPAGCRKLKGVAPTPGRTVYRVRQGDYRIVYGVGSDDILVFGIGHRKDIYR